MLGSMMINSSSMFKTGIIWLDTILFLLFIVILISAKSTDFTENMINDNFILYHDSDK